MEDYEEQKLWDIMYNGVADVECNECGHCATIEPDGDYECPECGEGRLVSPLVELGVI
jgi:DNA-directed RNA polymerase subunit RPC12/RpoP